MTLGEQIRLLLLFLAILGMALLQVAGIASIFPFMKLVAEPEAISQNDFLHWAYEYFGFESNRDMLIASGFGVIILLAASNIFSAFTTWLQHKYAWEVAHNISTRLLRNYLSRPYDYFLTHNTSDILNKTIVEVVQLTTGVLIPITEFAARVLVVLVIFVLLAVVDIELALIVLGALGLSYVLVFLTIKRYLNRLGERRVVLSERLLKSINEVLDGIKTFRVFGAEKMFYKRFEQASTEIIKIHPKVTLMTNLPRHIIEVLAFGGILGITLYLLITAQNVQSILPLLSLYALAGYRLLPALQVAFTAAARLRHSVPVVDKLYDDLQMEQIIPAFKDGKPLSLDFKEALELQHLSFEYEAEQGAVLKDLNVRIEKGKTVAFVGATGSGKSTLIDILVGLLEPQKGKVLVDGLALTVENSRSWQKQLGYVPQDIFLFDDSIIRNIAIGRADKEVDMAEVEKAAKIAKIHDFIKNELPAGYETKIGERGIRLSGGQKQRLGLARALYRRPQALILDEATSALDGITEHSVIEAMKQLGNEPTVIIIAHRLSTVRHADWIYLMEAGKIVDQGPYDQLLDSSAVFREMVEHS